MQKMQNKFQLFSTTLNRISKFDLKTLENIFGYFVYTEMEKNQNFILEGSLSKSFAFVVEGLFKVSFINTDGNEYF